MLLLQKQVLCCTHVVILLFNDDDFVFFPQKSDNLGADSAKGSSFWVLDLMGADPRLWVDAIDV